MYGAWFKLSEWGSWQVGIGRNWLGIGGGPAQPSDMDQRVQPVLVAMAEQKSSVIVRPLSAPVGCRSPRRTAISKNGSSITLLRRTHAVVTQESMCMASTQRSALSGVRARHAECHCRRWFASSPRTDHNSNGLRFRRNTVSNYSPPSARYLVATAAAGPVLLAGRIDEAACCAPVGLGENVGRCRPASAARGGGVRRSARHRPGAGSHAGAGRPAFRRARTVSRPVE